MCLFNFKKRKKQKVCRHTYEIQDIMPYTGSVDIQHVTCLICIHCEKRRKVEPYQFNRLYLEGLIIKRYY